MPLKQCLWVSPESDFHLRGYECFFAGDEACGRFMFSEEFISKINTAIKLGGKAGIIVPYLTPETESRFDKLINSISKSIDIVVNDAGAFRLVSKSKHTPIIGRLLARQNTDPAITSFFYHQPDRIVYNGMDRAMLKHLPPSRSLALHLSGSAVFSDETAALFLSGHEKMTVMLDLLPFGLPRAIPKGFSVLLNTDNILVAVLPCRSCDDCPAHEAPIGFTRANVQIYRMKNICYYKYSDIKSELDAIPGYVTGLVTRKYSTDNHERQET